jgi:uncharacterized repeat protein (TIGR01451 family)
MSVLRPRSAASLPFAAALVAVGLVSLVATDASAGGVAACQNPGAVVTQTEQRFSDVAPGNVLATGNTLGLSKQSLFNGPGISDSIGTFISLDPTEVDDTPANVGNPWFQGTTFDWETNGSTATLALPPGATVLHAELVWGGSYADIFTDVSANLNDPVRILFDDGSELSVAPEGAGINVDQGVAPRYRYYARKADVTEFVAARGVGDYTVAGVPAVQSEAVDTIHAAGWTLLVAYRDQAQPIRNLTLYFGGAFVDENTTQDYGFSGFCASPSGDLEGSAVITALEGDANRPGDVLCIAPSETPAAIDFVGLSGPNNPADNFFSSQINDADGELDTRGTFGDQNQDATAGDNVSGGRQGWDITQMLLSSADGSLDAGQTGATIRTSTAGDSYLPMGAGFSIDVNAPFFDPDAPGNGTEISTDLVEVGDTFTVTVNLFNSGAAPADNLLFFMSLPNGLSLQSFTTDGAPGDISGDPVELAELGTGVAEGSLASEEARSVVATIRVDAEPAGTVFNLQPSWTYDWVMCTGQAPLSENFAAASVSVDFEGENPTTTSASTGGEGGSGTSASTSTAVAQGGGNGDGDEDGEDEDGSDSDDDSDGSGGAGANGDDFVAQGGVMCATSTLPARGSFVAAGLAIALGAFAARRRRS